MSGIELAGLVLGAIPLILAALDGYQKLGRKRDAFTRRSFHIDRMKHVLGRQYRLIQGDIRLILRGCDLDGVLVESEILNAGVTTLRRDDVQRAVRQFLGTHHDDYMEVIAECERILLEILASITNVAEGSWVVKGSLAATVQTNSKLCHNEPDFWKKVRFTMRKDDMDKTISSLASAVQTLEQLRQRSQQLNETEIMATSRSSHRLAKVLHGIRKQAMMLYHALLRGWNWNSRCHDSHSVRFFLENTPAIVQQSYLSAKRKQKFSLAFEGMKSSCADTYHICDVEVVESGAGPQNVRFHVPHAQPAVPTLLVDDICHVVVHSNSKDSPTCFYLDDGGKLLYENQANPTCAKSSTQMQGTELVGLHDILSLPDMSLKGRVKVAALIAMAVIQLHSTPWCSLLQKESFYLLKDGHGVIDPDKPCVVCHFDPSTRTPAGKQKADAELELLNLGIMILELWHNISVESFAANNQIPLDSEYYSRLKVARKWVQVSQNSMLPDIDSAAKRCIGCRFDVADADLDDLKVISGLYEGVVKPLSAMAFGQSHP